MAKTDLFSVELIREVIDLLGGVYVYDPTIPSSYQIGKVRIYKKKSPCLFKFIKDVQRTKFQLDLQKYGYVNDLRPRI